MRFHTVLCFMAVPLILFGCAKARPPAPTEVVLHPAASLAADPSDAAWQSVAEFVTRLILQDLVEPRLMKPSTAEIRVRAMQCGNEIAFRLEWTDATKNDKPEPAKFYDACAIQVPSQTEPTVPAPQMGEAGRAVEIAYWNAGWQAIVDGRGDTITNLYPNAHVDHYPFEAASLAQGSEEQKEMAARYAPARALGNNMGGPRTAPVQDLIAEGPGTITPAKVTTSKGRGQRTTNGWSVVIIRPVPLGLGPQVRTQVAFAVWEGAAEEVGPRKMRTGWIPLSMQGAP